MAYPYLVSSILKETWFIEPRYAESLGVMVYGLLTGLEIDPAGDKPALSIVSPTGEVNPFLPSAESKLPNYDEAPKGSFAIVPVKGAMLKEDTWCAYGTTSIAKFIRHAADHRNVAGIILDIDSGGGAVNAVAPLVEAIAHARGKKPVVAYADTAASAAYWTAVACDQIIMANDISAQVGSVGVMVSFADIRPYYEKEGVKFHTVYAPESTHKNEAFELALQGKYDLIKAELLSPLAIRFQEAVKAGRPNLDLKVTGIISGKMFFAKEAVKHGMADDIGTLEQAIDACEKLAQSSNTNNHSQKADKMNPKLIASLLVILSYTAMESQKGMVTLSEADLTKIGKAYKAKHKRELELQGLEIQNGFAMISESTLLAIEEMYNKDPEVETPDGDENEDDGANGGNDGGTTGGASTNPPAGGGAADTNIDARIAALEAQVNKLVTAGHSDPKKIDAIFAEIKKLSNKSDVLVIQNTPNTASGGIHNGFLFGSGFSFDKADALRPYNMRALGMPVVEGTSSLDLTTLIQDLGDYSRTRRQDLISFMRENNILDSVFPFISGVNDEHVFTSLFLSEFTQAYQDEWTPKGNFEIQPEIAKVFPVKIDHELKGLKALETTWLSDLNKEGSNAYKMSFVGYLITQMLLKASQEDAIAAVKGVYLAPTPGKAGGYLNRMNGLLKYLRDKIAERKLIQFNGLGEWTDTNILDYERKMIGMIPENWRDAPNMAMYVSQKYIETRYALKKKLEGQNTIYDPNKSTVDGYENIRLIGIPYMGESKRVFITSIGNIRQLEFVPNEEGFIQIEKDKRQLNLIGDYKRGIQALAVGRQWAADETPDYEHQLIWCNDVDLPASVFVKMIADDVTPSVKEHTSLESVDNTKATAITDIKDLPVGGTCVIKCGSNTHAITIAKAGNFAAITAAWNPVKGDTITLFRRGATDIVDLSRTSAAILATAFTADDVTPSVDGGTEFITVANTVATAITNFDDAVVGKTYTIYGGSATNSATIANSGNFLLTAAMSLGVGSWIKLYVMADGKFMELSRLNTPA